jgi:hypothetical protein
MIVHYTVYNVGLLKKIQKNTGNLIYRLHKKLQCEIRVNS